ncbi:MAG: hypothetical protein FJ191_14340 [Gammaproteobacteria bacterium]|nr:hypothetical protein [Gammaproteobacteria bacterium]
MRQLVVTCLLLMAFAPETRATPSEKEAVQQIRAAIKAAKQQIKAGLANELDDFAQDLDSMIVDAFSDSPDIISVQVIELRNTISNLVSGAVRQVEAVQMDELADAITQVLADNALASVPEAAQAGAFSDLDKLQAFLERENGRIRRIAVARVRATIEKLEAASGGERRLNAVIPPIASAHVAIAGTAGALDEARRVAITCVVAGSETSVADDGSIAAAGFPEEGNAIVLLVVPGVPSITSGTAPTFSGVWFDDFHGRPEDTHRLHVEDQGNSSLLAVEVIAVP